MPGSCGTQVQWFSAVRYCTYGHPFHQLACNVLGIRQLRRICKQAAVSGRRGSVNQPQLLILGQRCVRIAPQCRQLSY